MDLWMKIALNGLLPAVTWLFDVGGRSGIVITEDGFDDNFGKGIFIG